MLRFINVTLGLLAFALFVLALYILFGQPLATAFENDRAFAVTMVGCFGVVALYLKTLNKLEGEQQ